jgi:hypothetical protein
MLFCASKNACAKNFFRLKFFRRLIERQEMTAVVRKKSPRAPNISLDDAIDRAVRAYDKDRRHAAPVDVFAQHLGYKNASNGAAATILASLRYYGLVDRPQEGFLCVSKEVEEYKFIPSEDARQAQLIKWLKTPTVFAELLEKYQDGLPSDATLKFDLIQRGFNPESASACLNVFRRSVDYVRYFDQHKKLAGSNREDEAQVDFEENAPVSSIANNDTNQTQPLAQARSIPDSNARNSESNLNIDRIPVRLSQGRRAWLEIPVPFYEADKLRLKAQIDMILTDEEN